MIKICATEQKKKGKTQLQVLNFDPLRYDKRPKLKNHVEKKELNSTKQKSKLGKLNYLPRVSIANESEIFPDSTIIENEIDISILESVSDEHYSIKDEITLFCADKLGTTGGLLQS